MRWLLTILIGVQLKKYILIDSYYKLTEAYNHIQSKTYIAYDTETTGLNVRKDSVIGFSFTGSVAVGFYFPILVWNKQSLTLDFHPFYDKQKEQYLLSLLKSKNLIMHNASYDVRITANNLKVNLLSSLYADTVLMEHTLNEDGPFGLKDIALRKAKELKLDNQDAANQEQLELKDSVIANGGKWTGSNKEMFKADLEVLAKYACADVDITLRLFNESNKQLELQKLTSFFYEEEVMPLYKLCTIRMEHRGIHIDLTRLNELYAEISKDITAMEESVVNEFYKLEEWETYLTDTLDADYPVSNKGSFAQMLCVVNSIPLPMGANEKYSLTRKNIEALPESKYKQFLLTGDSIWLSGYDVRNVQVRLYQKDNETIHLINIQSKAQLSNLLFNYVKLEPLSTTDKGTPQFNESFVETLDSAWAYNLRVYNKLNKIRGTYYDRFLQLNEDGVYYPTFKQHGTSSGRFSSDFQQLPRPKDEDAVIDPLVRKYSDAVRELVIAKDGYVFIDDDYESLEPRCFADDALDAELIRIFTDNLDMYSVVAIMAENITDASADKKSPDFLKKKYPQKRQNAKAYALGIRYGMKSGKLSMSLGIDKEEAQEIIDNYFKAFPKLKAKMDGYLHEAKTTGKVTSKFGRVRHLPRAKEIYEKYGDAILDYKNLRKIATKTYTPVSELEVIRKEYNNLLNNALNFPIQSAATSIVNRAAIAMTKVFVQEKLDAWVSLQIHDQVVISCNKNCIERVKEIVQNCMENTNKLAMPLIAKPEVARNLREGH